MPLDGRRDGQRHRREEAVHTDLGGQGGGTGIHGHISPHSLRDAAITQALDAGVPLRDAQILARHADPRTTERYDRARGNLDRRGVHFRNAYVAGVWGLRRSCIGFGASHLCERPASHMAGIVIACSSGSPFGGLIPGARGAVLSVLLRTGAPLTGRQVHGMVSDECSLWSVQEALKALTRLGIVETQTIGRAGVHTISEGHAAVPHLRALANPIAILRAAIAESVGSEVESVIVFGSIARGEASEGSDIDLAVIAASGWDERTDLEDAVRISVGDGCEVLVFTPSQFQQLARSGEPVVSDILRDGLALIGSMPRTTVGAL